MKGRGGERGKQGSKKEEGRVETTKPPNQNSIFCLKKWMREVDKTLSTKYLHGLSGLINIRGGGGKGTHLFSVHIANRLSRTEPFAISHLKLMKDDDTTIQDGMHELFVYKVCMSVAIHLVSPPPSPAVQGDVSRSLQVLYSPWDQRPNHTTDCQQ